MQKSQRAEEALSKKIAEHLREFFMIIYVDVFVSTKKIKR